MSQKTYSLGQAAAAALGIVATGSTNATPIVLTIGAGHGLKIGDRITVSGITGNTNANGEWTTSAVGATTATLLGSVGNGVHGGTPVIAILSDVTPLMKGHSARVDVLADNIGITAAAIGTVIIEGSDDNVTFVDVKKGVALPAFTTGGQFSFEVDLKKWMRMRVSAFTSGVFRAVINV